MDQLVHIDALEPSDRSIVQAHKNNLMALMQDQSQEIQYIRQDFRPVLLSDLFTKLPGSETLAKWYQIPEWMVDEVTSHIQQIGFVEGAQIAYDDDARIGVGRYVSDAPESYLPSYTQQLQATPVSSLDEAIGVLDRFFSALAELPFVQQLAQMDLDRSALPWGLFHSVSLYDRPYATLTDLESYLMDDVLVNLREQQAIFGENLAEAYLLHGGITVDDVAAVRHLKLPEHEFTAPITQIDYQGQQYDLYLRMLPGYSGPGVAWKLSLGLPSEEGMTTRDFITQVEARFEQQGDRVVPVIHTIQESLHDVASDENGHLYHLPETEATDRDFLGQRERGRLQTALQSALMDTQEYQRQIATHISKLGYSSELMTINSQLPKGLTGKRSYELLGAEAFGKYVSELSNSTASSGQILTAHVVNYLLSRGYPAVQIIDYSENLWLTQHNKTRNPEAVAASGYTRYARTGEFLGGYSLENGRREIILESFAAARAAGGVSGLPAYGLGALRRAQEHIFDDAHPGAFPDLQQSDRIEGLFRHVMRSVFSRKYSV